MRKTQIIAPAWANTESMCTWQATYKVLSVDNVRAISIESQSSIDIVVAKISSHDSILGTYTRYYISSPNYSIAIPWISSLTDANWITEHLIGAGIPTPDAVTVAQVLQELGDF